MCGLEAYAFWVGRGINGLWFSQQNTVCLLPNRVGGKSLLKWVSDPLSDSIKTKYSVQNCACDFLVAKRNNSAELREVIPDWEPSKRQQKLAVNLLLLWTCYLEAFLENLPGTSSLWELKAFSMLKHMLHEHEEFGQALKIQYNYLC